jgi:hypothetical protein
MGMAVFVVLVAVAPARAASASEACGHACSTAPKLTQPGEPSHQCLPDAGCGGGSLLTAGTGSLLALGATAGVVVAGAALLRRRISLPSLLPKGRLLAARLFRPPQFSLSF